MTLPASGVSISFSQVNTELGNSSSAALSATAVMDSNLYKNYLDTKFHLATDVVKFKGRYFAVSETSLYVRKSDDLINWVDDPVLRNFSTYATVECMVANISVLVILRASTSAPIVWTVDGNTWYSDSPFGPTHTYHSIAAGPSKLLLLSSNNGLYRLSVGTISGSSISWNIMSLGFATKDSYSISIPGGIAFNDTVFSLLLGIYNISYVDAKARVYSGSIVGNTLNLSTSSDLGISTPDRIRNGKVSYLPASNYMVYNVYEGTGTFPTNIVSAMDAGAYTNNYVIKYSAGYIGVFRGICTGTSVDAVYTTANSSVNIASLSNPAGTLNIIAKDTPTTGFERMLVADDVVFAEYPRTSNSRTYYYTKTQNYNSIINKTSAHTFFNSFKLSKLYGRSNTMYLTLETLSNKLNLRDWALAQGWDGTTALQVTSTAGIYSDDTTVPGLTINGSFPSGLTFINANNIFGMGGKGGNGGYGANAPGTAATAGSPGGLALLVSTLCTIDNSGGYIIGGGGGGGGGQGAGTPSNSSVGGGGGGGGASTYAANSAGGTRGTGGGDRTPADGNPSNGGIPGTGGLGGKTSSTYGGNGGAGGAQGAAGNVGGNNSGSKVGYSAAGAGGSGGGAVSGNSYITWVNTGTRIGAIS